MSIFCYRKCTTHPLLGYVRIGAELLSSWASASVEKKLLGNMRLDCRSKVLSRPGNIYCRKVANVATVLVFFDRNGYVAPVVCRPTTQRARSTIALFPWGLLRRNDAVWSIIGCPAEREYRRVYLGSGWNTLSRSLVSTKQTSCLSKSMCVSWMCKRSPYAAVYVLKHGENCPALCLDTVLEVKRAALKSVFRSWYINIYIHSVLYTHI